MAHLALDADQHSVWLTFEEGFRAECSAWEKDKARTSERQHILVDYANLIVLIKESFHVNEETQRCIWTTFRRMHKFRIIEAISLTCAEFDADEPTLRELYTKLERAFGNAVIGQVEAEKWEIASEACRKNIKRVEDPATRQRIVRLFSRTRTLLFTCAHGEKLWEEVDEDEQHDVSNYLNRFQERAFYGANVEGMNHELDIAESALSGCVVNLNDNFDKGKQRFRVDFLDPDFFADSKKESAVAKKASALVPKARPDEPTLTQRRRASMSGN